MGNEKATSFRRKGRALERKTRSKFKGNRH